MQRVIRYILVTTILLSLLPARVQAAEPLGDVPVTQSAEELPTEAPAVLLPDVDDETFVTVAEEVSVPAVSAPSTAPHVDASPVSESPPETDPPLVAPPEAQQLLISEVRLRGCINQAVACDSSNNKEASFVEIYNPSAQPVTVTDWSVRYVVAGSGGVLGSATTLARLTATIDGYGYLLISKEVIVSDAPTAQMSGDIGNSSQGYIQLLDATGGLKDALGWGSAAVLAEGGNPTKPSELHNSMQRCESGSGLIVDTNDNKYDFAQYEAATPGSGILCVVTAPPVAVVSCAGVHISEIHANAVVEQQFIELHNNTADEIVVDGCQLLTNRSATKAYVLPAMTLAGDGYSVVRIIDTDLTLTKTTSGTVYLLSSDGQVEVDARHYSDLAAATSWSWFGGDDWRQTYATTPGAINVSQPYAACEAGFNRNEETGRCNKIAALSTAACSEGQYRNETTNRCRSLVSATTLTPCRSDQYRSEETGRCRATAVASTVVPCKVGYYRSEATNRCRTLALAGGTLTPCKDSQYRSEETNRCRAIAASSTKLAPCKDGQYRSEETNRCRTIAPASGVAAAFAVQPIADSAKAFAGWWLLGGIGLLAVGYGAWEWRREVAAGLRKAAAFVAHQR